ncbi:hypothetical protein HDU81_008942 [Chytriomyces hyalinus]|nr:hypothetical protein HDU81_008942 [Chytriomyces hyalinus]
MDSEDESSAAHAGQSEHGHSRNSTNAPLLTETSPPQTDKNLQPSSAGQRKSLSRSGSASAARSANAGLKIVCTSSDDEASGSSFKEVEDGVHTAVAPVFPTSKEISIDGALDKGVKGSHQRMNRSHEQVLSVHGDRSYVSLRKATNEALETLAMEDDNVTCNLQKGREQSGSRGSSFSSIGGKVHPIIQWINRTQDAILKSPRFKKVIRFLAADSTKILICFFIMCAMHASVIAVFIVSLSVTMPGIWVYNFMQLYVMAFALIAHEAAAKLSGLIRTSITAGDLIKGRITMRQMADYWVKGPKSPAHRIICASATIGTLAELILAASSIVFSWEAIQTKLKTDFCIPPIYDGSTLPPGIDIKQFIQGDIDFAEVYNYGLPLADGIVGGWPGWPLYNPMNQFQIKGEGPLYVIQVLCDNGVPRPDLDYGTGTAVETKLLSDDRRGFMVRMRLYFPRGSVYDDVSEQYPNVTVMQTCSAMISVGHGMLSYHFVVDQWEMVTNGQLQSAQSPRGEFRSAYPTSVHQYTTDAYVGMAKYNDDYNVVPLMKQAIMNMYLNQTFYPSQGATFCNAFSQGTMPDGFYHTLYMFRGVSVALAAVAHFAVMQFQANATHVPCDYYGYAGSGMLIIPQLAIYLSVSASAIACLIKCFEILWWYMAQNGVEYESYRRARRMLKHPLRFAIDAAEMLASGMAAAEHEEDTCDATTTRVIEELGNPRILYGEDLTTREMEVGHLRIGEFGKVKGILKGKKYGTYRASAHTEWEDFVGK